jgi:hypothetical protein
MIRATGGQIHGSPILFLVGKKTYEHGHGEGNGVSGTHHQIRHLFGRQNTRVKEPFTIIKRLRTTVSV